LEWLLAQGDALASVPAERAELSPAMNAERALMTQELRLACTQGVLLSLERDQRIAWILAEIFDLSSAEAAAVLEIEVVAYRKRLSRARERLETWMRGRCGLVNGANACRCARQVPIATAFGALDVERLEYARHSGPALRVVAEADEIEAVASVLKAFPDDHAPPAVLADIRTLIDSGRFRVFDA
ncbi:MAG TPA: sigma-70 region 4 domain-containing protein, partial [Polyangiaceae bacterium]